MIVGAHGWLPDSAVQGPVVLAAIDAVVCDWSEAWLARGKLQSTGRWRQPLESLPARFTDAAGGLGLACDDEGRLELAGGLLNRELRARDLRTEADRAMIDKLVDNALEDLGKRLARAIGSVSSADAGPRLLLDLATDEGAPLVTISIARQRLVALVLSRAQPPRRNGPARKLASALEQQSTKLTVRLGGTRLSLAEVEQLQLGDVVILDQPTHVPLDLLIADHPAAEQAVSLVPGPAHHSLRVERSPASWPR